MTFIPNDKKEICIDPEHEVPTMMVFPPEGGKWVCPSCGEIVIIHPRATL